MKKCETCRYKLKILTLRKNKEEKLMDAVENGDLFKIKRLISIGADVNRSYGEGCTLLMKIADEGDKPEVIEELIKNGADVNARDIYGWTSLMRAVSSGKIENVRIFVKNGAKIDIKNRHKETALMMARKYGSKKIINILTNNMRM